MYLPHIVGPDSHVIIAAAHIDSAVSGEADEAILLWNTGAHTQDLAGWQLATATRRATIPVTATLSLGPGQRLWSAAEDVAFQRSFGYPPACAWDTATYPNTLLLSGGLALTNHGGQVQLRDAQGKLADALLYGDAIHAIEGWSGAPAQAYDRGAIGAEGQVWQRKRHAATGQPLDSEPRNRLGRGSR